MLLGRLAAVAAYRPARRNGVVLEVTQIVGASAQMKASSVLFRVVIML